jgi:thiopeptide-type bacteriocin biosynthesis protein
MGEPLIRHSGFFVARLPLLSIDELDRWEEGAQAPQAVEHGEPALEAAVAGDRERLVARLRARVLDPALREALFVASPSLDQAIDQWLGGADPSNVTGILTRYFSRLASRATPFGLFATSAVGTIVPGAGLRCAPDATLVRHTRLDMEYVCALAGALERRPETRARLRFTPSNSLYERAGQLRYIEARVDPVTRERRNDLVAIEATTAVREVLREAAAGATPAALATALASSRPRVTAEEAAAFVDSLIDSQVLVSPLTPAVTGGNPLDDLIGALAALPGEEATTAALSGVREALAALDAAGSGVPADRYRTIARALETLPAPVELRRLFHVDLYRRDAAATLGEGVVAEIAAAVEALAGISAFEAPPVLTRFRQRFSERYERRAVSLVEALDEDLGVGFAVSEEGAADPAPLLDGIGLGGRAADSGAFTAADAWKLRRVMEVGPGPWALTTEDLAALAPRERRELVSAFAVMATVVAPSAEAVERGEYAVVLKGAAGPSGARLFGRFCHGDPALREHVEAHLRAEEAGQPEAIFAEVVHLPQGRLGNILCRPALRAHEIPYLARPGVDEAHTIPVTDLMVSVERGRVVLRSRRLGREIVPRLTSAHAVGAGDLPLYHFLTALQNQDDLGVADWSWGPLASAPRLPRVTLGRVVLEPARFTLRASELAALCRGRGAARFRAAVELRRKTGLPRWISLGDRDQLLGLDLDNVLHVDAFAELVRDRSEVTVLELLPLPEDCCLRGSGGRYTHELAIPFVRPRSAPAAALAPVPAPPLDRSFAPGSEWLTAKIYCGPASIDRVLREIAAPLLAERRSGIERWFFLRYGDPEWHLRLRFQGVRAQLLDGVLCELHDRLAPLLASGLVARLQLDTYQREIERYGGPEAMPVIEEIFRADSEAALGIVERLEGDEGADARWRLALRGTHDLLVDFGLALPQRLALVSTLRARFAAEHGAGVEVDRQLGQRFRVERKSLTELLASPGPDHPLAPGLQLLGRRSARLAPLVARLREVELRGQLAAPRDEVLAALLHMHANRVLLSHHRAQELVLHDFLQRHYTSEAARARAPRA